VPWSLPLKAVHAGTPECPTGIALSITPGCSQAEIAVVSSWQPVARRVNRNFCAIINDATGRKLFFKHNLGGNLKYIVTDWERRRRDVCNILASRILTEIFALHSIVYIDCVLIFSDGSRLSGIAATYIEELRWLEAVTPQEVVNQQDALHQMVVLTWLGDLDRLKNPTSDFVTQDGLYGTLDFDFCFNDGVSFCGLPLANRRALEYFKLIDTANSIVTTILELTDADIAKMVERLGHDWVTDWSEQYQSIFVGILIRNRERLSRSGALQRFDPNMCVWLRYLDGIVTLCYEKLIIPKKVISICCFQGFLETTHELKKLSIFRNIRLSSNLVSATSRLWSRCAAGISGGKLERPPSSASIRLAKAQSGSPPLSH
jgi:hypothetical protein